MSAESWVRGNAANVFEGKGFGWFTNVEKNSNKCVGWVIEVNIGVDDDES